MSFFKFRRGDANSGPASGFATPVESVEVIRKRARHRLIGASVLVLLGVVGFPLLFDTQPRPVSVDIPIQIPGKTSVKPLHAPASARPASASAAEKAAVAASPKQEKPTSSAPAAPASPVVTKEAKPETKPEAKPERKPAEAPAVAAQDDAIPPISQPAAAEGTGRSVVQVGAFSDSGKADETRAKLERAGLKTYTQIIETKDGKRIRVRVGPFATKAEAEKVGSKIRALELPVAILTF
jgi:DedD protein